MNTTSMLEFFEWITRKDLKVDDVVTVPTNASPFRKVYMVTTNIRGHINDTLHDDYDSAMEDMEDAKGFRGLESPPTMAWRWEMHWMNDDE